MAKRPKQGYRNLIPIGGSVGITIPVEFLKKSGWKVGDQVAIVYNAVFIILSPVSPEKDEDENK